ncbi:protein kinase [Rhodococcus sp. (in: high G+C Gram-positive bacteria)]|uniref:protein kinase domain-containing protein n=1 Tax=Rhodococcus TaxID=1827 RepID=UPI00257FC946|nr:protein kinase [Rhodococcus sp. (in: high G+C Gram-positive bacteria)]
MGWSGELRPGSEFAGYTIEKLLGVGGMAAVYLAAHPHLPRSVALKVLHPSLTSDEYVATRFEREAAHVARFEHPNIVQIYDCGRCDGRSWLTMQYVAGATAADLAVTGPVAPGRAVHILTETGKALDHAHHAGILHRDVKPANILVADAVSGEEAERVLLADFGIAKALDETGRLTRTGTFAASLQNAAPEQFDTSVALDHRADQYSLGCTFFHLLTGHPPYPGRTLPQLWHGHAHSPIPRPSATAPRVPAAMDAVIARALAKDRDDRFGSCHEFSRAAQAALETSGDTQVWSAPQPRDVARSGGYRHRTHRSLRVVLADDSVLLREGIRSLLTEEGIEVAGEAGDATGLLELVEHERPDVAVVDIRMPPSHTVEGIEAAQRIRTEFPETAVLLLSQYVESEYVMDLLAAGASGVGYLLKDRVADVDEFVDSLHRVADGGSAIDPGVVSRMVSRPHTSTQPIDELSAREREVLGLMAQGRSNRAIGASLFLGERTVEAHIRSIFLKLGLHPEPEDHRRVLAVLTHLEATTR